MGCCFSSTAGSNAPYASENAASPSSRAINESRPHPSSQWAAQPSGAEDQSAPASPALSRVPSPSHRHSQSSQRQTPSQQSGQPQEPGRELGLSAQPDTQPHDQPSHLPTSTSRRTRRTSALLRRRRTSLSEHVDEPLRRFKWQATSQQPWTREQLDKERTDFFDTRVTGRPEIWQALRLAMEVLWEADSRKDRRKRRKTRKESASSRTRHSEEGMGRAADEESAAKDSDTDDGVAAAQAILRAAEVTLPTGNLSQGAYDQLGNLYHVPEWVVCDPTNLSEGPGSSQRLGETGDGSVEEKDEEEEEQATQRRKEKGKAVLDASKLVKIRVRLSDTAQDVTIKVRLDESSLDVARTIKDDYGLDPSKRVRLSYLGKMIKEEESLEDYGFQKAHILNAYVFDG